MEPINFGATWLKPSSTNCGSIPTINHLQELELAYFEDRSTGTLLSILNDDINQLERFPNFGAQDLISKNSISDYVY